MKVKEAQRWPSNKKFVKIDKKRREENTRISIYNPKLRGVFIFEITIRSLCKRGIPILVVFWGFFLRLKMLHLELMLGQSQP